MSEKISYILRDAVNDGVAAGTSALVFVNGQERFFDACGYADREAGKPLGRDSLMHMYSMTKVITSIAILTLYEKGALDIYDKASRFIPELADTKVFETVGEKARQVPAQREVTVFDLLTMTSGLSYGDRFETPAYKSVSEQVKLTYERIGRDLEKGVAWDTLACAREFAKCPLNFQPGACWMYGYSTDMLGAIVSAATGKGLGAYMDEVIFEPLGMRDTFFRVPQEKRDRVCALYRLNEGKLARADYPGSGLETNPADQFESGGGGLVSTMDDYAKLGLMLLGGGALNGRRILEDKTVRLMAQNHLNDAQLATFDWPDEAGYGYGLSVRVMMDPKKALYDEAVGAFGWNGAAGTSFRLDPKRGTMLIFGIQCLNGNSKAYVRRLTQEVAQMAE